MKKLIFFICLIPMLVSGQEFLEYTMFDMSGVTGDTLAPISIKEHAIIEVDFTDINCDVLGLKIGYTLTDTKPAFLPSFGGLPLPVTLSTVTYTQSYLGVEVNQLVFNFSGYHANYVWIGIVDDATCTSGNLIIRQKK
jgi:hypothetical protein